MRVYENDRLVSVTPIPLGLPWSLGRADSNMVLLGGGSDWTEPDPRISKEALSVTAEGNSWSVTVLNGGGAIVRPWLSEPVYQNRGDRLRSSRPGMCIELRGDNGTHRVVLERHGAVRHDPGRPGRPRRSLIGRTLPSASRSSPTTPVTDRRTKSLTESQVAAIERVFHEHLAWPPRASPRTRPLAAAAVRLTISVAAVRQRLQSARSQVEDLIGEVSVTEPALIYALAERGLLEFPFEDLTPRE